MSDIADALAAQRAADAVPETPDEPAAPAEGSRVCEYCGKTHDVTTVGGFILDMIHDVLYIVKRLTSFFAYELYVE